MHLVINQVVELEHVHVTHRHRAFQFDPGTAIEQAGLPGRRQIGQFQHRLDLGLARAIENRRRHRHTGTKISGKVIERALVEAEQQGVKGKEVTLFLLAKLKELTAGDSFAVNLQLLYHNAQNSARLAVEMAKLYG